MWASPEHKEDDGWWMINLAIDEFNMIHQCCLRASFIKKMDESMSAFFAHRCIQQVISHTSHIACKNQKILELSSRSLHVS